MHASAKLCDNLYLTDDSLIEGSHFLCGNPVFRMRGATSLLDAVIVEEVPPHLKTSDIAGAAGWDVPVAGNLHGILFRQHRIKDRLFRKSWRERAHSALADQFQLARANRPPKGYDHLLLPAGVSTGVRALPDLAEIDDVLSGEGTATVGGETAPLRIGDALAIRLNERQSFAAAGGAGLELLIVGVSRDMDTEDGADDGAGRRSRRPGQLLRPWRRVSAIPRAQTTQPRCRRDLRAELPAAGADFHLVAEMESGLLHRRDQSG